MKHMNLRRRRVLQFGLGGAAALGIGPQFLTGGHKAMAAGTLETTVYVSNAGSNDIYCLAMNRETGELTMIEKVKVPGAEKPSPASLPMATSLDKRFLYAQLRSEPFPVSAFAIGQLDGRLTVNGTTPLSAAMAYVNVDRTGRWLFGASYVSNKLEIHKIDALYVVEDNPSQIVETPPKAHCVIIDSGNKFVYLPVLGGDEVLQFTFDAKTGKVAPNDPPAVKTKQGAGPRHLTFHPNHKYAYLHCETAGTMTALSIDKDKGTLSEIQTVPLGDFKENAAASDIHVTPNGQFVYGAVRSTSTLHGFKIDPDKGTLTEIGKWPTEKEPRGFNIDPRGKFLLAVGMQSASMTSYAIGADGALKQLKQYPMGTQPNWIEIVDLPKPA